MSKDATSKHSQTDWEYLKNLPDDKIDFSEAPEITEAKMAKAVMRLNGKVAPRKELKAAD